MAAAVAGWLAGVAHAQGTERVVAAGTTASGGGWRASLFVTRPQVADEQLRLRGSTTVGARLSRSIARNTRLTVDIFNVFDAETPAIDHFAASRSGYAGAMADSYLFHPAEERGVRVGVGITFK